VKGKDVWRQVGPTRSYLSQSELPVTMGLGKETEVEALEVKWPSGATQRLAPVIDRVLEVTEP
jgi:enediyne biosynthesis protein E4